MKPCRRRAELVATNEGSRLSSSVPGTLGLGWEMCACIKLNGGMTALLGAASDSDTAWRDPEETEKSWCVWAFSARRGDLVRMLDFVSAVSPRIRSPEPRKPGRPPTHGHARRSMHICAQGIHSYACEPRLTWIPTCIVQPS